MGILEVIRVSEDKQFKNRGYISKVAAKDFESSIYRPSNIGWTGKSKPFYYGIVNNELVIQLDISKIGDNHVALHANHLSFLHIMDGAEVQLDPFDIHINDIEAGEIYLSVEASSTSGKREIASEDLEKQLIKSCFFHQVMHQNQKMSFSCNEIIGEFTVFRMILASNRTCTVRGMLTEKTILHLRSVNDNLKIMHLPIPGRMMLKHDDIKNMGIGGMSDIYKKINDAILSSRRLSPRLSTELGIKHSKGVVFYGPPGTGKTLMAKTIAKLIGAKLKVIDGPSLLGSLFSQSMKSVRDCLTEARADYKRYGEISPIHMILFDELDSITTKRGVNPTDTKMDRVVSQMLTMIDGATTLNNIILVGTTNRLDLINPAILRSGRFSLHIKVDLPDEASRLQILEIHTGVMKRRGNLKDVALDYIASRTDNFSGADLAEVSRLAFSYAITRVPDDGSYIDDSQIEVLQADFLKAIEEIGPRS